METLEKTLGKILAVFVLSLGFMLPLPASAEGGKDVTLYKNPNCGCCEGHAAYLRQSGFNVTVVDAEDPAALGKQRGMPDELQGCHTSLVGGYIVEGHVSADLIDRLLAEKPRIVGISLPGMPMGVPGMGGSKDEQLKVYEIAPGAPVFGTQ
jgi:hypothetical protein